MADIYSVIWKVFQPVLFGLIGAEIDLSQLKADTVLYGLCVLAVGLTVSMCTVQGSLYLMYLENYYILTEVPIICVSSP